MHRTFRKQFLATILCVVGALPFGLFGQHVCGTQVSDPALAYLQSANSQLRKWVRQNPNWTSRTPDKILIQPHILLLDNGNGLYFEDVFEAALQAAREKFLPMNIDLQWCSFNFISNSNLYFLEANEDMEELSTYNEPGRINLYFTPFPTVNGTAIGGFAFLPGGPYELVVVRSQQVDDGSTLSHEFGHYFGLYHTHGKTNFGTTDELVDGSNCGTAGDDLCDTPADPNLLGRLGFDCIYSDTLRDNNGDLFRPDPSNLMSYADPWCTDTFSQAQYTRMRFFLENGREHLLSAEDCDNCLEVTSLTAVGKNSLAAAIDCANNNPGPDTISINVGQGTIFLSEALPALVDDGTYIRSALGGKVTISANLQIPYFFQIEGSNVILEDLEIRANWADETAAISVLAGAENFILKDLEFSRARRAIGLNGVYGTVSESLFEGCETGISFGPDMGGIYLTENNFVCNIKAPLEGAEQLAQSPPVPEVLGITENTVFGEATPGAMVEIFAQNEGLCPDAPCQGEYLGRVLADQAGKWNFDKTSQAIQYVTATATVENGGKSYTSDFAACWALVPGSRFWLYPNPVTGSTLHYELKSEEETYEIRILNLLGQTVFQLQDRLEGQLIKKSLNLGDWLPGGTYVFELTVGEEQFRQKIMIQ
ncbi:MAG: zinc-dependent metalloprotease [Bacteroidota bacterium]